MSTKRSIVPRQRALFVAPIGAELGEVIPAPTGNGNFRAVCKNFEKYLWVTYGPRFKS